MLLTMSSKGQITIPKAVRESLHLEAGDTIVLIQVNNELVLKPMKKTIFDFIGAIPAAPGSAEWDDIRGEALEEHANEVLTNDHE
jgi:AbrB family looped-hinge helix DNA binding protein